MKTLIPAYGRDYKSIKAVKEDYNADKDFIIADFFDPGDGKPINKSQIDQLGMKVSIRYNNLQKIVVI